MTEELPISSQTVPQDLGQPTEQPGAKPEKKPDYSLATLSGCLVAVTPLVMAFLWMAEALWRPLGIFLYLVMMGFSFAIVSDKVLSTKKRIVPDAGTQALVLSSMVVILVAFSQINRYYYIRYGGFEAANDSYWHWLRYGTASVADAMLRGVPQVWEWQLTEITPVAFWPRVMLVLFQLAADVLAIGGLLRFVQKVFTARPKPQPETGSYPRYLLRGIGHIVGLALWSIPLAMGIDAMVHGGWNPASTWPAIQVAAPLVVGIWLVQRSYRGIRVLSGRWNRLGAAAGLGAGAWLVWANWAALRAFLGQ